MKKSLSFIIIVLSIIIFGLDSQASRRIKPSDPRLKWVGRVSLTNPETAVFTYPGIQLWADFSGKNLSLVTKPGSGYFMVEIDEMEPYKVHSSKNDSIVVLAKDLPSGEHYLTLTYVNEGLVMKPEIHGLLLDDGEDLTGVPVLPERKIEFLGDSITCGLGNEGDPNSKKFDYSMQNLYYTYEAIASRELEAQYLVVARSGTGIYRNNNGDPKGDKNNFNNLYPYTQFGMSGEKWDYSRYIPDVVCVNLGTNDTTNPRYDTGLLANAFKKLLKTLRSNYPEAKIVLLTGTMLKDRRLEDVKQAHREAIADAAARGDNQIYSFDFTPDDGSLGKGVYNHPSRKRHERMAEELVPFLREITGWE